MDSLVGFRFQPTNEEIILLLKEKRLDPDFAVHTIKEIDFYSCDPWDLPRLSGIQSKEPIWYFYSKPYYKYSKSKRVQRRTASGYWKITGKGSDMKAKNSKDVIGSKKILSFYLRDSVAKEAKTEWVMHEIHIKDDDRLYKGDFVVCRLERKQDNKPGISTSVEGESSQHSVVAENTSPKSVLPPNQQLQLEPNQYCDGHNAMDNDFLQLLSNHGYNPLDNDPCSELQSLLYPEQELAYSNSASNDCDWLNSLCDCEPVDNLINSPKGFQNIYWTNP